MIPPLFSGTGRLGRRDFALTIGAIMGGASLMFSAGLSLLLPLSFLLASAYFRDMREPFWFLLILGFLLLLTLITASLPLAAIPASMRRLHDLGRSGWLTFPLPLLSLLSLIFPAFFVVFLLEAMESVKGIPTLSPLFNTNAEEIQLILRGFFIIYTILAILTVLIGGICSAFVFLKKGTPGPNAYGDPPAEEPLPSVRTAFLTMEGTIDRHTFVVRTLLVLAAVGMTLPTIVQLTLYPVTALFQTIGLLPVGADYFVLLMASVLYPLAALPLVVQRLHTLGRRGMEAAFTYAALIPVILSCIPIADLLSVAEVASEDEIGTLVLAVGSTASDSAFIALWTVCGIASLVSILRLLADDAPQAETNP